MTPLAADDIGFPSIRKSIFHRFATSSQTLRLFAAVRPPQQPIDHRLDRHAIVQYRRDGRAYRHLDVEACRQTGDGSRGRHPFHDQLAPGQSPSEALPPAKRYSKRIIARLQGGAGEDEIAETG
jgi:hypothetical protein